MVARQPLFSPKQLAEAMQVSQSSVKRWCDAGVIDSLKTVGGHRRISWDSVLQFLRDSKRTLLHPEILGMSHFSAALRDRVAGADDPVLVQFRSALVLGDEATCRKLIRSRIQNGASVSDAANELIRDAMRDVGQSWRDRRLDIFHERRACEIAMRLLAELRMQLPPPDANAPVAIGAAPETDLYQLPGGIVELTLRDAGWNATNLGCNLPLESVLRAVQEVRPDVVWLSVSCVRDVDKFIDDEHRFAEALPASTPLFIGGQGICGRLRQSLSCTAFCESPRHMLDIAATMVAASVQ